MRYGEYVVSMLRKEKNMSAEYQHQSDLFLHGFTQCAHCGDLLHQSEARVHVYYDGEEQQEEHFCPDLIQPEDSCHNKWYMQRLREEGL